MRVASELAPSSAAVHALHGRAQLSLRRFRLAASSLERARQLGDGSLRTTLYLAAARWENGDLAGSEEMYREAVARTAAAPLPLHQLGRLLLWQGRYEDALVPLRQAAARTAELDVRLDLARALDRAGRDEEAIAAYRLVVEAEPEHPRAHYGLGRALARLGRAEEAARHLAIHERLYLEDQQRTRQTGLLDVEPDTARAETAAGRPDAALGRLAPLPETPDVLAARAAAHRRAGDLRAAVAALERAVAAAPEREDLRALLRDARIVELEPR
jgi:Flp pilus assembly protein TadD